MRGFVLATVVGAGILLAASLEASAVPANGAAIAGIGQQVNSVINARKQHVEFRDQCQEAASRSQRQ